MDISEYANLYAFEQNHWWFVARRQFIESIFTRFAIDKGGKRAIVDIGAGTGGMIAFLNQYGKVVGIEPSIIGRNFAKKRGIPLRKGSASNTGLHSNSFDMVCFLDVLYHQNINESEALAEAFRLLKPNGYLIISDCAFAFLYSPHDVAFQAARRYTRNQIESLITQAGFTQRYSTYTFFLIFPLFMAWRLLRAITAHLNPHKNVTSDVQDVSAMLNTIMIMICKIESLGYRYVSYPWGSSVVAIAQKKD